MDGDLHRIWQLIHELSEQLAHNQKLASTLKSQANALKAVQTSPGFALRRFNVDISKETFESDLERSNAQFIIENQTLLQENRQLSMLLKEYEQTLDTIMVKFRLYAGATSQYELTLTRHYEALLLTPETMSMSSDLASATNMTTGLQHLTKNLRKFLRSMSGEEPESDDFDNEEGSQDDSVATIDLKELTCLIDALDEEGPSSKQPGADGRGDWALEREWEISRLEKENEELRRLLGIDSESVAAVGINMDDLRLDSARHTSMQIAAARRRSASGSGFGMGGGHGSESWGTRQPATGRYSLRTGPAGVGPSSSGQQQQQQQQQGSLQHAVELPSSDVRFQGRRPGMLGPAGELGLARGGQDTPPLSSPRSEWSWQTIMALKARVQAQA